jgi:5-formyltetrahydrofolate cyclo-ligase
VTDSLDQAKRAARELIWNRLEEASAVPPGVHGHIPNFAGKEAAAARLAELDAWQTARVVKANPDKAQLPVRVMALAASKLLYMAVPRLATVKPFYRLDPGALTAPFDTAASGSGASDVAPTVAVEEKQPVDLIVCGSVVVNRAGGRVGKGAGYSDIEVALLTEAGLVGPSTTIVTTVHQLQVVDGGLPEAEHDFSVDVIVTPEEVIRCGPARRPRGISRELLNEEQRHAIPALGGHFNR